MLVVMVNLGDRLHSGVVGTGHCRFIPRAASGLFSPVVNPANKGRDQLHLGLGASHRLAKREQQRQIGADAALLQLLCGFNAFPSSGNFDQNAPGVYTFGLV